MSVTPSKESLVVEFKSGWNNKNDGTNIKKTIVAFANTAGGDLYLGVGDDGSVVGVHDADALEERISCTIRDNIAYADPDATDEQIIAAAKAAHAHGFITRLPQGYHTPIGEDGGSLSAGQKQLLCIARVMLRLPPMLILDEATSSIDTLTEIRIQKAFDRMMEGRTSFVVAHRLSTIQNADLILVMKDGHIIEQGSHLQLLEKGGFYAQLYQSQFATE